MAGRRDFVSVPGIQADRYEVVVDEEFADRASELGLRTPARIWSPSDPSRRRIAGLAGRGAIIAAAAVIRRPRRAPGRDFRYDDPLERLPAGGTAAADVARPRRGLAA